MQPVFYTNVFHVGFHYQESANPGKGDNHKTSQSFQGQLRGIEASQAGWIFKVKRDGFQMKMNLWI